MPHRRTPIRRHDGKPPAGPQHPVDLAQTGVEIGQILEHLHGKNGIKLGVAVWRRRNIAFAAFDPSHIGAASSRCRDLVRANVDGTDPIRAADKLGHLTRIIPAAATHLQHPLASAQVERLEDRAPADDESCDSAMACCRVAMLPVNASVLIKPPSLVVVRATL